MQTRAFRYTSEIVSLTLLLLMGLALLTSPSAARPGEVHAGPDVEPGRVVATDHEFSFRHEGE